ncbi:hypothetical protein CJF42_08810 [Pseudoalteromonas sp. NBT06-2]|uniref:hypothetical protein n=1 Tax=Pseudoalteromonas sp. NBT06-2 TaxID=2025950 RepID=UPI000BA6FF53|nr:hypothetical protein [Pseudoalteromonas sp. NBT06-2]PAJ74771.1 hypothetical protein CJF42_08810 [Pseudoalteromonas sp. NBT06-2]
MTLPSNKIQDDKAIKMLNEALDDSVNNIPKSVLADLEKARNIALMQSHKSLDKTFFFIVFETIFNNAMFKVTVPIAAVILISLSITSQVEQSLPQMPLAMVNTEIPYEDLVLLDELEFITWLAENEQNALL